MIPGLDSSTMPSAAQALAAKAAGVSLWSGYIQTQPGVGLYAPWTQQGFENARLCGSTPIAYCSGWDDPVALKALAAAWNVRLCVDVEGGIRPALEPISIHTHRSPLQYRGIRAGSAWLQPFLDASGAGLYANPPYHGYTAPFHILADYPGYDPGATWLNLRPAGACAWQWEGTHSEFGVGVDRGWFDDWFAGHFGPGPGDLTSTLSRRSVTIVATKNTITLLRMGTDKALWFKHFDGIAGTWGNWQSLGGIVNPDISTVVRGDQVNVFVTAPGAARADGTVSAPAFHIWSDDGGANWSQFEPHDGDGGPLAAVSLYPEPIDNTAVLAALAKVSAAVAAIKPGTTVDVPSILAKIQQVQDTVNTIKVKTDKDLA